MISPPNISRRVAQLSRLGVCIYLSAYFCLIATYLTPLTCSANALESLLSNESALLGKASVTGEFNSVAKTFHLDVTGPRARDYSIKMVWVPSLEKAFFTGANHQSPHRLNDVWSFDLAAMEWHLVYGPDNPRAYRGLGSQTDDVRYQGGLLRTKRGGPAIIGHTWWGITYDPELKKLLFMNTWVTDPKKAISKLGKDPSKRYRGPPLWSFDPQLGTWQPIKTTKPWPKAPFGGFMEYIPELNGALWHSNNWQMMATWLYRSKENTWQNLEANRSTNDFRSQAPRPEQISYYDPVRKIVVAQSGRSTHHFDIATTTWSRVLKNKKEDINFPLGHDARSVIYYDQNSGHGLLFEFQRNTIWAYNPDKTTWRKLRPNGPPPPKGRKRLAYFDPSQNILVVIKGTLVWTYRYIKKP